MFASHGRFWIFGVKIYFLDIFSKQLSKREFSCQEPQIRPLSCLNPTKTYKHSILPYHYFAWALEGLALVDPAGRDVRISLLNIPAGFDARVVRHLAAVGISVNNKLRHKRA